MTQEKFRQHISVKENGCWHWTAYLDKENYGRSKHPVTQKPTGAHRVSYLLFKGEIPDGTPLDHKCHDPQTCPGGLECLHRRCVNPDHVELSSAKLNRSADRGHSGQWQQAKTRCVKGHEYTEENTGRDRSGHRFCKTCKRLYWR